MKHRRIGIYAAAIIAILSASGSALAQNPGVDVCPIEKDSQLKTNPGNLPIMHGPNNWWKTTTRTITYTVIEGNPAQDPCDASKWFTTISYFVTSVRSKTTVRSRKDGFEIALQYLWNILAGAKWQPNISYDTNENFTTTDNTTVTDKIGPDQKAYKMSHSIEVVYEEQRENAPGSGQKKEERKQVVTTVQDSHRIVRKCETYNVCTQVVDDSGCPTNPIAVPCEAVPAGPGA